MSNNNSTTKVQLPSFFQAVGIATVTPIKMTGLALSIAAKTAEDLAQAAPAISDGVSSAIKMGSLGIAKLSSQAQLYLEEEGWDDNLSYEDNRKKIYEQLKKDQEEVELDGKKYTRKQLRDIANQ